MLTCGRIIDEASAGGRITMARFKRTHGPVNNSDTPAQLGEK